MLLLLFFGNSLFALSFENMLVEFGNEKNLIYVGNVLGNFSNSDKKEGVAIFKKENSFQHSIFYFLYDDNQIIESKKIQNFYYDMNSTSITEKLFEKYNSFETLCICCDNNDNGVDEIIVNQNVWGTKPLMFEYSFTEKTIVSIWDSNVFPNSIVITPGAPNEYEMFRLLEINKNHLHLIRFESDLIQHFYLAWNPKKEKYDFTENQDFFLQTGFCDSMQEDFNCLSTILHKNDLINLSAKQLRLLRNAVYARHGYIFKTWDLADNFTRCIWYKENPLFKETDLTGIEKQNIETILSVENTKEPYKPIDWPLLREEEQ